MMDQNYPHLFEPLEIRGRVFKNRIFSAPNMLFQVVNGRPTDQYVDYLEHKARGGAAAVTLGEAAVCEGARHTPPMYLTPENLNIYGEMAMAIHQHGALASVELYNHGSFEHLAYLGSTVYEKLTGKNAYDDFPWYEEDALRRAVTSEIHYDPGISYPRDMEHWPKYIPNLCAKYLTHGELEHPLTRMLLTAECLRSRYEFLASPQFNANRTLHIPQDFYQSKFIRSLREFTTLYQEWLHELKDNVRSLSLFHNIEGEKHPFDIIDNSSEKRTLSFKSDYYFFYDRLNRAARHISGIRDVNLETRFLMMFFNATEKLTREKIVF